LNIGAIITSFSGDFSDASTNLAAAVIVAAFFNCILIFCLLIVIFRFNRKEVAAVVTKNEEHNFEPVNHTEKENDKI